MNSPKRIVFSANDLGGAQAIAPVVTELIRNGYVCEGMLTGPAREIFRQQGIPFKDSGGISDAELKISIDTLNPDLLLAGRSVEYTIDKRILLLLRAKKVPSAYVLDFWNYYWEWFSDKKKDFKYMPTIICVMDERAKETMLEEGFSAESIIVTGNPYFEHFSEGITRAREDVREILFISQPISSLPKRNGATDYGFDEFKILNSIIAILPATMSLSIRLHPREDSHKYDSFLDGRVHTSKETTLEESLSHAGLVVSMFSPVLLQAAAAGKNVLSYEPGLIGKDPLPTNELGITKKADSEEELKEFLTSYQKNKNPGLAPRAKEFFTKGATERVCGVITQLLNKR